MSVVWCMGHVWQAWISKQTTAWLPTTPQTCSAVTLDIGIKSFLNHGPHQWYSDSSPRMMIARWIWHPTILRVVYKAWTTSDRERSPHWPHHYLKLHPIYTQLLPCILEGPRAWTTDLVSSIAVQGWWHSYIYTIPPFYECCMRHGPHLTGLDCLTDHSMISNYGTDILSCYPGCWNKEFESPTSSVV